MKKGFRVILTCLLALLTVTGGILIPEYLTKEMKQETLREGNETVIPVDQIHPYGEEAASRIRQLEQLTESLALLESDTYQTVMLEETMWSGEQQAKMERLTDQFWNKGTDILLDLFDLSESAYSLERVIYRIDKAETMELGVLTWNINDQLETIIVVELESEIPIQLMIQDLPCSKDPSILWDEWVRLFSEKSGLTFFPLEIDSNTVVEAGQAFGYDLPQSYTAEADKDILVSDYRVAFSQYGNYGILAGWEWNPQTTTYNMTVYLSSDNLYNYVMGSTSVYYDLQDAQEQSSDVVVE